MYLKYQVRFGAKWVSEFGPATEIKGTQSYTKKKTIRYLIILTLPLFKNVSAQNVSGCRKPRCTTLTLVAL